MVGLAGLAGSAVIGDVSGCASSQANAVVSGGITIDDEVSCGEKLVGPVSEILMEARYIRYAGELDEACRGVPAKAFDTSDYIDKFGKTLDQVELSGVRVSDEYEAAADGLVAEAKSVAPSEENIDIFVKILREVVLNYNRQKDKATYDRLAGTSSKIRKTMDSLEKQMGVVGFVSLSVCFRNVCRMTGSGAFGNFERFKAQKLANLHRKVWDSVNLYRSMLESHFLLKSILPSGKLLIEEPPVDLELERNR